MSSRCGVLILIGFAAALLGRPVGGESDPPSVEGLQKRFVESYGKGDFPEALRLGEELAAHFPDSAALAFDLSRLGMLNGDPKKALEWLQVAAAKGFSLLELLDAEPDLKALRDRPEYRTIRERVRESQEVAWDAFTKQVAAHPPRLNGPRDADPLRPVPLIVALHGRGGKAKTLAQLWRPEARRLGAVLATPQGLEPYADGFEWGTPEETTYQVLEAIAAAGTEYPIDPERIVLTGFSQGGRRSISIAFRHPDRFAGVIVVGSAMDRHTGFPQLAGDDLPRFYFMVGVRDNVLPRTRSTSEKFAERGIVHDLVVFPGVGHTFPADYRRQLRRATDFVLERDP